MWAFAQSANRFLSGTVKISRFAKGVFGIPTTLAPFLSVRNGAKAVDFYKLAFGAEELFRHETPQA